MSKDQDDSFQLGSQLGSEQIMTTERRERAQSDEALGFQRQRTNTFKYVYCDYDISQMQSTVKTAFSDQSSNFDHTDTVAVIQDERWYDKSSAAYFTSKATRNAQTVSWQQRHRPVFQLYADLQTGIILLAILLIASVIRTRALEQEKSDVYNKDFLLIVRDQIARLIASLYFFIKFFAYGTRYRCTTDGNVMERSSRVFWTRNLVDLGLYALLIYIIYLEYMLFKPTDSTSVDDVNEQEDKFLANIIGRANQVEYSHFYLLGFLIIKEIFIYFTCVVRASRKINKEIQFKASKAKSYVGKEVDGTAHDDGFGRQVQ